MYKFNWSSLNSLHWFISLIFRCHYAPKHLHSVQSNNNKFKECLVESQATFQVLLQGYLGRDYVSILLTTFTHWSNLMHLLLSLCSIFLPNKSNMNNFCGSYCLGKVHRLLAPLSMTVCGTPFTLIFVDVWSPNPLFTSYDFPLKAKFDACISHLHTLNCHYSRKKMLSQKLF